MFQEQFQTSSQPSQATRSLNYVWLNKKPLCKNETFSAPEHTAYSDSHDSEFVGTIPIKYIQRITEAARSAPSSKINLWIDKRSWPPELYDPLFAALEGTGVNICNLRDIPEFEQSDVFHALHSCGEQYRKHLWARVDLARLYVLKHLLLKQSGMQIFYSDFDVVLPWQDSALASALEKHGMVFARCEGRKDRKPYVENSFIGFTLKAFGFLSQVLIPNTLEQAQINNNGYATLIESLKSLKELKSEEICVSVSENPALRFAHSELIISA